MKKILLLTLCVITLQLQAQVYMYGTTSEGGANNLGTIYRVDQNGQNFEKVFDFSSSTGGTPFSGLTLAENGKLYGFTTTDGQIVNSGATLAMGSFYEFDPVTENLTVIEYIDDKSVIGNTFNNSPTKAPGNLLYIASETNGLGSTDGVLSSYDVSSQNFAVLDTFDFNFGQPKSKLLLASDGDLYVTTSNGGANSEGAVVKFDVSGGVLSVLHSSDWAELTPGDYSNVQNNELFEASNGALYGSSFGGGINLSLGMLYTINKDGTGYQNIYSMSAGVSDEGFRPQGGFVEHNGFLYSTTTQEDVENVNSGTIYTINLSNNTHDFIYTLDLEGAHPRGTFTVSPNGRFYISCNGGAINSGGIMEYNPLNGTPTNMHSLTSANGIKPMNNALAIVDFNALSVDDNILEDLNISIYPNPVSDYLSIDNSGDMNIQKIDLFNTNGQLIYSSNSIESINLSAIESGIYFVQLRIDSGRILTKKILKE